MHLISTSIPIIDVEFPCCEESSVLSHTSWAKNRNDSFVLFLYHEFKLSLPSNIIEYEYYFARLNNL